MTSNDEATAIFAVYRIEGEVAILLGEELDEVAVPLTSLPDPISEETVLRVRRDGEGTPAWGTAELDDEGDDRRRAEEAEALMERIREWKEAQKEAKKEEAAAEEQAST